MLMKKYLKMIADEWKALATEKQAKYQKLAEEDKLRFNAQNQEFEKKGFFTMTDGQQSNHVLPSKTIFLDHVVVPTKPKSGYNIFISNMKDQTDKNTDTK